MRPMAKKRSIVVGTGMVILLAAILILCVPDGPQPSLTFVRYVQLPPSNSWYAELMLSNATKETLWVETGTESDGTFEPSHHEKPKRTWNAGTNSTNWNVVATVGSYFMTAEEAGPGGLLVLHVGLMPGDEPRQIGVIYHQGNYKDRSDFMNRTLFVRVLVPEEKGLLPRIKSSLGGLIEKWKRSRNPERMVWCPTPLAIPAGGVGQTNQKAGATKD
jgi:hypothetical protein